jgi:hypothetical protein
MSEYIQQTRVSLRALHTDSGELFRVVTLQVTPARMEHATAAEIFWRGEVLPLLLRGEHVCIVLVEPNTPCPV